jgi:hypothetical protein
MTEKKPISTVILPHYTVSTAHCQTVSYALLSHCLHLLKCSAASLSHNLILRNLPSFVKRFRKPN